MKKSEDQRVAWWVYAVSAVGIVGQLCIALVNVFDTDEKLWWRVISGVAVPFVAYYAYILTKDAIRERARRES
jgi:hypothetical protein